jgi:hypothetical protein
MLKNYFNHDYYCQNKDLEIKNLTHVTNEISLSNEQPFDNNNKNIGIVSRGKNTLTTS